jgi:hypothetical protein
MRTTCTIVLWVAGCASKGFEGDDEGTDADADTDADTDTGTGTGTDSDTGTGGGPGEPCATSGLEDTTALYDFLMEQRRAYGGSDGIHGRHDRWKGIPWVGEYHTNTTFPDVFDLDSALAARAQTEADRLAGGGAPAGEECSGQSMNQRSFWDDAIDTADWRISFAEEAGDWDPPDDGGFGGGDPAFALHQSNGTSRLGFHYHDFGGDGPVITHMGIGVSCADETTWWVLQMGE